MTTIGDALGIDYRGAEANISHSGRVQFSHKALAKSAPLVEPPTREAPVSISGMLASGAERAGDNLDVYA